MKQPILILLALLYLPTLTAAQSNTTTTAQNATTPVQQAQLTEIRRLSARVKELYAAEKYNEALKLSEDVLQRVRNAFGENHQETALALSNNGAINEKLQKRDKAERSFRQALQIYAALQPPDEARQANMLENIARLRFYERDFKEAESLLKQSLAIREKRFGVNSAQVALSLFQLGESFYVRQKNEESLPYYERAIAILEKIKPTPTNLQTALVSYIGALSLLKRDEQVAAVREKYAYAFGTTTDEQGATQAGGVLNGRALQRFIPRYPIEARAKRASGAVNVQVTIDETGKVISARAITGDSTLRAASEEAARQWRFAPTLLSGQPVKVTGVIIFNYMAY